MMQKPNFTQASLIRSLEQENAHLRAQAQGAFEIKRLIEAAVTGLATRFNDPEEIAAKAINIAGAVIEKLESLGKEEQTPAASAIL
jgi:hypothetical protein